ncbi:RHS repeat domain-containing protein, partial [Microbulbifer epialgicus]
MEGKFSKRVLRAQRLLFSTIFCIPWIANAENLTYQYDDSDRLIQASYQDGVDIDYSYDALGNLLSLTSYPGGQNTKPSVPVDEYPENGSKNLNSREIVLSWNSYDTNDGDLLFYDLYLGLEENPPLYKSGIKANNFKVTNLHSEATYYWRLVARDNHNAISEGPLWNFVTSDHTHHVDFEEGFFEVWFWKHGGTEIWTVDSENPYDGNYGIRSGDISASQVSSIETVVYTPDGDMFFYLSISSESCCDKLEFYIDDELKGSWSGSVPYQLVIFPVSSGIHRFKWQYKKDGSNDV